MSDYPHKVNAAFNILTWVQSIETGPLPVPGVDWKPEYGRELTKAEAHLKDSAIAVIELYFATPGFGSVPKPRPNPFAAIFAGAPPGDPPAQPPGNTVPITPTPPPEDSDTSKPPEKKPETEPEKKPA